MKYVIENSTSAADAQNTINSLMDQGYPRESISLIADETMVPGLDATGVTVESSLDVDDTGLWERIKDFFMADSDHEQYKDLLDAHRQDIANGNVLVIVDDDLVPDTLATDIATRDNGYWADCETRANQADTMPQADMTPGADVDDETIRLEEERLNVDKENVKAGDVVLRKRVVEENQTINVPVRHEEVVVERRPVNDMAASADSAFTEDTVTIPLWEEQVNVTKQPVVTEEVHVAKSSVQDSRQVSGTVRKEKLDVEKTGNVVVKDTENNQPRM